LHATFDLPDARLIAPGDPGRSVLLARMDRRGPGQMPQVGTTIVDREAVTLIRQWIESLAARPAAGDAPPPEEP
jgi:mono/diheme cytochrome c family protein